MRLTKMLGFAALAAVTAMAFVGMTSASATNTVLCKANELICETVKKIEHATISALSTNATLLSSLTSVLCEHSVISAKVLLLANPLVGHIEIIGLSECEEEVFGTNCTVTSNNAGLLKLLKTGANAGSLTAEGVEMLFSCPELGLHCRYGNPTTSASVSGSQGLALAVIALNNVKLPEIGSKFFCPNESKWDATYTVTTPDPVYIAE